MYTVYIGVGKGETYIISSSNTLLCWDLASVHPILGSISFTVITIFHRRESAHCRRHYGCMVHRDHAYMDVV